MTPFGLRPPLPGGRHDGRGQLIGAAMVLASAVCFGATATLGKLAYDHGADAVGLLALRFSVAAVALLAVAWWHRRARRSATAQRTGISFRVLLLGALFCAQALAFFESLALQSTVVVVMLFYTYPLVATLAAAATRSEHLTGGKLAAMAAGLVGVPLALGGVSGSVTAAGVTLALTASGLFAVFLLVAKDTLEASHHPLALTGQIYAVAALGYLALAAVDGASLPGGSDGWLAAIALVATTLSSMVLYLSGLRRLPVGVTALLSTLEPAIAVALAAIVLGERVLAIQVLGILLILASILSLGVQLTLATARRGRMS